MVEVLVLVFPSQPVQRLVVGTPMGSFFFLDILCFRIACFSLVFMLLYSF